MATIVNFEIPADDLARAKTFYSELFGWKIEKVPMEGATEYWFVGTTGEDGKPGLGGGMMARQSPEHQIANYVGVDSVDASAARVEQLGGKVVVPKTPVPGFGFFAVCLDTENNVFGLWVCAMESPPCQK